VITCQKIPVTLGILWQIRRQLLDSRRLVINQTVCQQVACCWGASDRRMVTKPLVQWQTIAIGASASRAGRPAALSCRLTFTSENEWVIHCWVTDNCSEHCAQSVQSVAEIGVEHSAPPLRTPPLHLSSRSEAVSVSSEQQQIRSCAAAWYTYMD
jgi:hypothetical protein